MDKPEPVKVCYAEGDGWYTWDRHKTQTYRRGDNKRLRAVEFADGSIFDAVDGWRPAEPKPEPKLPEFEMAESDNEIAPIELEKPE